MTKCGDNAVVTAKSAVAAHPRLQFPLLNQVCHVGHPAAWPYSYLHTHIVEVTQSDTKSSVNIRNKKAKVNTFQHKLIHILILKSLESQSGSAADLLDHESLNALTHRQIDLQPIEIHL
jgi:hypothetical protein